MASDPPLPDQMNTGNQNVKLFKHAKWKSKRHAGGRAGQQCLCSAHSWERHPHALLPDISFPARAEVGPVHNHQELSAHKNASSDTHGVP